MTKYKLCREYPKHKIGDIAIHTVTPQGKGQNTFEWENGAGIPFEFFPGLTPDWWEKIEEEKKVENYESLFQESIEGQTLLAEPNSLGIWYSLKYCFPRIYWTEVLRIIAKDLNKEEDNPQYGHTIRKMENRYFPENFFYNSITGSTFFDTYEGCKKAIDLLGNNIKYLFYE